MKFLIASLAFCASSVCFAEDCSSMPPGPEKRDCIMRNNPRFETKFDRCNEHVIALGADVAQHGRQGRKALMQACMRGRPD
jgi:hypothetical protein